MTQWGISRRGHRPIGGELGGNQDTPIYMRATKDNAASLRIREKCGFAITGEDRGIANARGEEVEEFILELT